MNEFSVVIVTGQANFMIKVVKDKAVLPKAQNLVIFTSLFCS